MASPQCENGYTKIANELLEAMIRTRIPGQEMRVMLAVLRFTYGYGKKQDQISYGQIAKMTEIPRVRVIEHVKSLVSKKGLGSLNNGTRKPLTMWINKDFEQWQPSPMKETSPNHGTKPSPNHGNRSSPNHGTLQRKKEIRKKYNIRLPEFIPASLWKDFKEHRSKIRKPMTPKAEEIMVKKLTKFQAQGYDPVELLETMIEKGWQSIELEWLGGINGHKENSDPVARGLARFLAEGEEPGRDGNPE